MNFKLEYHIIVDDRFQKNNKWTEIYFSVQVIIIDMINIILSLSSRQNDYLTFRIDYYGY